MRTLCAYSILVYFTSFKLSTLGVRHSSRHRRSQGGQRGHSPQILENVVILCFEKRFSKQNTVIRLKSNILPLPKNFWAGYATASRIPSVRLLFDETFAQASVFAVVDCADGALSVFYSPLLTRCRIFLQL